MAGRNKAMVQFVECVLLAATIGCSTKVEVESANWTALASVSSASDATTSEKARTAIQLDVLQTRPSEPLPSPKPATSGNTVVIQVNGGDIHVHERPSPAEPTCPKKSTLNTKIGWPTTEHSPSAFTGYCAVCLLVGTAVVLMAETSKRTEGGPMLYHQSGLSSNSIALVKR
ncbi:MAG: hypothetical protein ABSF48_24055 [Thermodesulfobacteriota bacterium]